MIKRTKRELAALKRAMAKARWVKRGLVHSRILELPAFHLIQWRLPMLRIRIDSGAGWLDLELTDTRRLRALLTKTGALAPDLAPLIDWILAGIQPAKKTGKRK